MAAVDSFQLLYQQVARSCHGHVEFLAVVGAWYTARKGLSLLCECYSVIRLHVTPRLLCRTDLVRQYGEWAVVTGATDGIGKAYAEELASRGVNIILISRSREKLQRVPDAIAGTYGVRTSFIEADFSRGREVYPPIKEALRHVDVGILVNNAGVCYEYPEYFTEAPEDILWDIINVNIAAATMMVYIVLPGMVKKKKGAIVNVSSGCCHTPIPQMSLYSASKVCLDGFSRELEMELSPKGIFVQSLIPGCVGTTTSHGVFHPFSLLVPSPEVYAHHAVRMLGVSTRTTGYWAHSMQLRVTQCVPGWLRRSVGRYISRAPLPPAIP
ncbi:inactive hydroxysteroid dehydrogenase-like protein 1 [Ascaphus truei]|uniref:inactive hydroxysteroid dehydrogenase-like protein 1 n=1 Tax=Ascaphus truei TaxID=8439 RepID=UPI003F59855B